MPSFLNEQLMHAVFVGHLSGSDLPNLYVRWKIAHRKGNQAAMYRNEVDHYLMYTEMTDVLKLMVVEFERLRNERLSPGRCDSCPAV